MGSCCGAEIEKSKVVCPCCGSEGIPVGAQTLRHLVVESRRGDIGSGGYRFCPAHACPVVYYGDEQARSFYKEDLAVKVNEKESDPAVPLCYCFNISEQDIRSEVLETGQSSASERIRAEVKAGHCACDIKNPSGRCCLKNVERVEQGLMPGWRTKSVPKPDIA
ncbi:MAG: copper chaperone Copz family protein [Nitrospinae bacterium]|nr:copper chaperone Copz family protein [Nitrospinota bacterium]